jgi:hypothetical protein
MTFVQAVAYAGYRTPGQRQIFDVQPAAKIQTRAHGAQDPVDAGAREFDHVVAEVIDHIGVVAGLTLHVVGTGSTVEQIIAGSPKEGVDACLPEQAVVPGKPVERVVEVVTHDCIVQRVADTAGRRSEQGQVRHIEPACRKEHRRRTELLGCLSGTVSPLMGQPLFKRGHPAAVRPCGPAASAGNQRGWRRRMRSWS